MEPFEAHNLMQSIVDVERENFPRVFIYPNHINVRAFRVSVIYASSYLNLASCLNSVGLKDFVADYKVDNAHFQELYNPTLEDFVESSFVNQLKAIINAV